MREWPSVDGRGYAEARGHYRLAVKHLIEQDHPSANSQLRNMVESLVVNLAVDHANYIDTGKAGQGTQAVRALYERDGKAPAVSGMPLPEFDGGRMLHGIWETLHPSGSHPAVRCGRGALQDAALHRARAIPAEALPSKATIPIGKLRLRASWWGD